MTVSIVIAGVSGDAATGNCVASIKRFVDERDIEIVVMRGEPSSVFQLRAIGIERASGTRIAVVGDRYEVTPSWLEALFEEHSFDLIGGCVAPGPGLSYWGWCVYLSEYAHVAPRVTDGETHDPKLLAGGNVVYNAPLVHRIRPQSTDTDLSFHSNLLQANATAGIKNHLKVLFARPPGFLEYVRERFWFSRTIAGRSHDLRKLLYAPLLPLVVLLRTGSAIVRKRRYRLRFLMCAPAILLLGLLQAAGECAGVVAPPPEAGTPR